MKFYRLLILGLVAFIALVFQSGCDKHAQDRQAIYHVMQKLGNAATSGDGDTYADLIASENLDYYGRTLKLALSGKKPEIAALPFHQRYEILLIRLIGKRKELKELDAKGYIAWSVKSSLHEYMPAPDTDFDLGHLTFRKDEAFCELQYSDGKIIPSTSASPYTLRFCLEGGQWKFDKTTFDQALDIQIQTEIKRADVDEDRALLYLLGKATGQEIPATIWSSMLH